MDFSNQLRDHTHTWAKLVAAEAETTGELQATTVNHGTVKVHVQAESSK